MALWKKTFWMLLWCLPAVGIGWLVYVNGVDVPVLDQWDGTFPLFEKAAAGRLGFGDFFAQHNEHRIFFPRLIMFLLGRLTHWNVRAEMGVTWLLAWICLVNICILARNTGWKLFEHPWLVFSASALIFSPLAYENWLFGFQLSLVFPIVCFTLCLWVASAIRLPWNFTLTIFVCTVCTFSIGSGFGCWLLAFPLLLLPDFKLHWHRQKTWWLLWAAGFLASTAAYFTGYVKPPVHPGMALPLEHPFQAGLFYLAFLGNAFGQGTVFDAALVSQFAGFALLTTFLLVAAYLWIWRSETELLRRAVPWIGCAFICFFHALLITAGRFGLGVDKALVPRYLVFSTTLPVSLLFLVPLVFQHWRGRKTAVGSQLPGIGGGLTALTTGLVVLYLLGVLLCGGQWKERRRLTLNAKASLELVNVVDDPEFAAIAVHPKPEIIIPRANVLNRLGYLRPPLVRSKSIREIAGPSAPASNHYGEIQQSGLTRQGDFGMIGWASLPEKRRAADGVVLTYDDANGQPVILTLAQVGMLRTEVPVEVRAYGDDHFGWAKVFPPGLIPPAVRSLRAWAFDAEEGRAYELRGSAQVPR